MTLVLTTEPNPGVRLLTLNRPEARNALSVELRQALTNALADAAQSDDVRVVVLTGGQKIFAAGADLREFARTRPRDQYLRHIECHWNALTRFPKPLIAAVNGFALGGGFEMVLHADIIVASDTASFGLPEVTLGFMPGGGGTQRVMRAIGKARAMRLLMTGDRIGSAEALRLGLISEHVEGGDAIPSATALAGRIAALPPIALRMIKEAALTGVDAPLEAGLAFERRSSQLLLDTDDLQEGIAAFLEKRPAEFRGQ